MRVTRDWFEISPKVPQLVLQPRFPFLLMWLHDQMRLMSPEPDLLSDLIDLTTLPNKNSVRTVSF